MKRLPVLVSTLAATASAAVAIVRRRRSHHDAKIWQDATSDSSR